MKVWFCITRSQAPEICVSAKYAVIDWRFYNYNSRKTAEAKTFHHQVDSGALQLFNSKATMTKSKSKQVQVHQVFDSRYYDGVKMQRILEDLFPERKGNFGLRVGVATLHLGSPLLTCP
jgi:hypothetical protein